MSDLHTEVEGLLQKITPGEWFAVDWPSQGWTVCWKQDAPICHMRWTDGLRPDVEARIEAEAKFIAAAPRLLRALLDENQRKDKEIERLREALLSARVYVESACGAKGLTAGMAEENVKRIDKALTTEVHHVE